MNPYPHGHWQSDHPSEGSWHKTLRKHLRKELEQELSAAEVAFEEAGGRGVELAERIDELRARTGQNVSLLALLGL